MEINRSFYSMWSLQGISLVAKLYLIRELKNRWVEAKKIGQPF